MNLVGAGAMLHSLDLACGTLDCNPLPLLSDGLLPPPISERVPVAGRCEK